MNIRLKLALWLLRTCLMMTVALLLICAPFLSPADNVGDWIGKGVIALFGVIVLYVEGWCWWNRVVRPRT